MSKFKNVLIIAVAFIVFILLINMPFTVGQREYAAVRQFGRVVRVTGEPGLHVKVPFIQNIQKITSSTQLYDVPASDVITKDKKSMIADNYILWMVNDPLKYIQSLNAIEARAEERIEAAVYNATKNVISSMTQDEVIESRGEKLTELITTQANTDMGGYGIVILQSQIKSLDLPDDNKEAVYERMISERQNIAASYTAQGQAEAQKIRNETDREVTIMKADAEKQAAILVAEGEAEYMAVLSEAYNNEDKAEFYNYIRGLDAVKASLVGNNKTLILDRDSELASILYGE
ncbi:MAG TPA: protease modulator HflC [Lachnospiraceae bacterium]|nr:protease modulator HflC [Lachnospiraceae bacterium]